MKNGQLDNLLRPKNVFQHIWDFVGAPLRMALLPDNVSSMLGLTSLQIERFRAIMPQIQGRLLDIGAGDNLLVKSYSNGIGVDVYDFGGGATIVEDSRNLPFSDVSFDTVTFIACLNHIPYRNEVLKEAYRILKPGGKVIATMISPLLGIVGHAIWWYSEEKERGMAEGEVMGISDNNMKNLLSEAGFSKVKKTTFLYGMNRLYCGFKNYPAAKSSVT